MEVIEQEESDSLDIGDKPKAWAHAADDDEKG